MSDRTKTKLSAPDPEPAPPAGDGADLRSEPGDPATEAAIAEEYGQLVATGPLRWHGCLAFAAGHPVPVSHPGVPMWLAAGSVKRVGA